VPTQEKVVVQKEGRDIFMSKEKKNKAMGYRQK
jgi:hypothetical protein